MIIALDTHATVKSLTAAGFSDAPTAIVKQALDVDLSNIATKTDIADLRSTAQSTDRLLPAGPRGLRDLFHTQARRA